MNDVKKIIQNWPVDGAAISWIGHEVVGITLDGCTMSASCNWLTSLESTPQMELFLSDLAQVTRPEPEPTQAQTTEYKYFARSVAAPRIMARWAAYNDQRLASGDWSEEDFSTFQPLIGPVVIALLSYGFGACRDAILSFSHPLATDQAKLDYIAIMAEEYPPLAP